MLKCQNNPIMCCSRPRFKGFITTLNVSPSTQDHLSFWILENNSSTRQTKFPYRKNHHYGAKPLRITVIHRANICQWPFLLHSLPKCFWIWEPERFGNQYRVLLTSYANPTMLLFPLILLLHNNTYKTSVLLSCSNRCNIRSNSRLMIRRNKSLCLKTSF
jgi:hypothetical protein